MSATEIPARLLNKLATVERFSITTELFAEVLVDLPCRLSKHKDSENTQGYARSSETEFSLFFCNRQFNGDDVDLRYEDRLTIDGKVYKVLDAHDSESAQHHIEADLELLKDLSISP